MSGDCAAGRAGTISRELDVDTGLPADIAGMLDSPHRFDNPALGAPCPVSTIRRAPRYRNVLRAPGESGPRATRCCSLLGRAALVWNTGIRDRDRADDRNDTRTYQQTDGDSSNPQRQASRQFGVRPNFVSFECALPRAILARSLAEESTGYCNEYHQAAARIEVEDDSKAQRCPYGGARSTRCGVSGRRSCHPSRLFRISPFAHPTAT
jgi:hypothetical protein